MKTSTFILLSILWLACMTVGAIIQSPWLVVAFTALQLMTSARYVICGVRDEEI